MNIEFLTGAFYNHLRRVIEKKANNSVDVYLIFI